MHHCLSYGTLSLELADDQFCLYFAVRECEKGSKEDLDVFDTEKRKIGPFQNKL
jgi:hypothetical protein